MFAIKYNEAKFWVCTDFIPKAKLPLPGEGVMHSCNVPAVLVCKQVLANRKEPSLKGIKCVLSLQPGVSLSGFWVYPKQ